MGLFQLKGIAILLALFHVASSANISEDELHKLIETIQTTYDGKFKQLTERIENSEIQNGRRIDQLERRVFDLEKQNAILVKENQKLESLLDQKEKIGKTAEQSTFDSSTDKINSDNKHQHSDVGISVEGTGSRRESRRMIRQRSVDDGQKIAFTVYLDHDLDHQGPNQTLVFNKVLLNDGNGYNHYTGIFTVPISGVYSISFFVGQRNAYQEYRAWLVVNNGHQVDAAVETLHAGQDSQGGNTANLRLNKGDAVYVVHVGGGTHVEGDTILRTTTFSGFLIYPIETPSIVGR